MPGCLYTEEVFKILRKEIKNISEFKLINCESCGAPHDKLNCPYCTRNRNLK